MKKIFLIIFLLLFCCNRNNVNWYEGSLPKALENSAGKIIMVDFYADW